MKYKFIKVFFCTLLCMCLKINTYVYAENVKIVMNTNLTNEDYLQNNNEDNIQDTVINECKDGEDVTEIKEENLEYDSILSELEYNDIQEVVNQVLVDNSEFDFENMVNKIIYEKNMDIGDYIDEIINNIQLEIQKRKDLFIRLFVLSIISAIFCNFSNVFSNKCVSEMGFYITYLLQFSLLLSTFFASYKIAEETLSGILKFMKVLIPTYSIAVIFGTGVSSAGAFYETAIIIISVVYSLVLKFILPLINVYTIIAIVDNIAQKRMLDKFANLLKIIIRWSLRGLLAIAIGVQSLQKMLFPISDSMKNNIALKTAFSIPVIGDTFENIGSTVIDAGILVKNAVGIVGIIVIIIICGVPLVRILVYNLLYMILGAVAEPIADKRIVNCISGVSDGEKMLLEVIIAIAALFVITISMVTG